MGHQEVVLGNDWLVRIVLGFHVLDVIAVLVLWERQGTSSALEGELELGLGLLSDLRGHIAHFSRDF